MSDGILMVDPELSLVEIEANLLIGELFDCNQLDALRISALGGSKSVGVARGADLDDNRPAVMVDGSVAIAAAAAIESEVLLSSSNSKYRIN